MPLNDMFNVTQNNPDFWRNLQQFGFSTMAAGAKPGATTLGALGEGGMATSEAARQNALARAQSEYYGQNTLNKKLENQVLQYDWDLDQRARTPVSDNLTPMMDTGSPSMTRTPTVGMLPTQPGTESRQTPTEDVLLRIARGNVSPRNVGEAEASLAYAKKGSAKEKYLQDYIEANRFTGEKAKATLPYELKKSYASANAGAQGQIQRLMETGLDRQSAISIVDGSSKVVVDPVSGSPFLVNMATGTSKPLSSPIAAPVDDPPNATKPTMSLYDDANETAGAVSGAKSVWNATAGQIGLPIAEATEQARTKMKTAQSDLIRSLALNERFPVGEMKMIRDETNIAPNSFDSSPALQARMRALDTSLSVRMKAADRDARDPSLPKETRQAQAQNASAIRNFLKILDVPKAGKSSSKPSLDEIFGD